MLFAFTDPGRVRLNKLCEIEDFRHALRREAIRDIERRFLPEFPLHPTRREHRKSWEYAQLMLGLRQLGALRSDAMVLSVAAGSEYVLFWLTEYVRMVFATDIYGSGQFARREAEANMLFNPGAFVPHIPYNRNRLRVQYMNALDLRYEDDTFDVVFSLSSIEHFGGLGSASAALREMSRVAKPGGVVMLTTECIYNGRPNRHEPGLEVFTPDEIRALIGSAPDLDPVEEISFRASGENASIRARPRSCQPGAASGQGGLPARRPSFMGRPFHVAFALSA